MRLSSRAKIAARHALRRAGFDLVRSLGPDDLLRRRMDLLRRHDINVLFDVGANAGQYALTMRALGYEGRIVSFEPSSEAYGLLAESANADPNWTPVNCGLGGDQRKATLHIAANSQSSSVLPMLSSHLEAAPDSSFVADEDVELSTLAAVMNRYAGPDDRLFVKIDTQGSEMPVIQGAGDDLRRVLGMQVELSLVPMYQGQPLLEEMVATLRALGYVPVGIEPDFFNSRTGELLQADGLFFRPIDES